MNKFGALDRDNVKNTAEEDEIEQENVKTEVLYQVEMSIFDLEMVKVAKFDKEFYPVDGLIKARSALR